MGGTTQVVPRLVFTGDTMTDADYVSSKSVIVSYWRSHEKELADLLGQLPDWGEPACWVCNWNWRGRYSKWDDCPVERCHITPKSKGGANTPDNIVLMCSTCHDLAPDAVDPRAFGQWAKSQNWLKRWSRELLQTLDDLELPLDDVSLDKYARMLAAPDFHELLRAQGGGHWFRAPRSGIQVKPATVAALLCLRLRG